MPLKRFAVLFLVLVWQIQVPSRGQRSFVPGPLKVRVSFEAAWKAMNKIIKRRSLEIQHEERAQGLLVTGVREYSSGPLVEGHIDKIGLRPKLIDGQWLRVHYRYRVVVELIEKEESLVTVNGDIEALKHDFLGGEEWIDISSNGKLEVELLTEFGQHLFGQNFRLELPKKKFWEKQSPPAPLGDEPFLRFAEPKNFK